MKTVLLAAGAAALLSVPAAAATLSIVGATPAAGGLPSNFSLDDGVNAVYDALTSDGFTTYGEEGDPISVIAGPAKTASNGLRVDGPARVTYTYLGSEAGNTNSAFEISAGDTFLFGNKGVSSIGDVSGPFTVGAGFLPFAFETTMNRRIENDGAADSGLNIAYSALFNGGRSVLVFFGDNAGDSDHDDLGVRIDVAAVPLPAAAWMLIGGLAGLAWLGREHHDA